MPASTLANMFMQLEKYGLTFRIQLTHAHMHKLIHNSTEAKILSRSQHLSCLKIVKTHTQTNSDKSFHHVEHECFVHINYLFADWKRRPDGKRVELDDDVTPCVRLYCERLCRRISATS